MKSNNPIYPSIQTHQRTIRTDLQPLPQHSKRVFQSAMNRLSTSQATTPNPFTNKGNPLFKAASMLAVSIWQRHLSKSKRARDEGNRMALGVDVLVSHGLLVQDRVCFMIVLWRRHKFSFILQLLLSVMRFIMICLAVFLEQWSPRRAVWYQVGMGEWL